MKGPSAPELADLAGATAAGVERMVDPGQPKLGNTL
jgi:hypothetical protein